MWLYIAVQFDICCKIGWTVVMVGYGEGAATIGGAEHTRPYWIGPGVDLGNLRQLQLGNMQKDLQMLKIFYKST